MTKSNMKKATDEELIEAYNELKSVWKVADKFNMAGQTVWERLKRLGVIKPKRFTEDEINFIKEHYNEYADAGKLEELCRILDRPKTSVVRKARQLGLTNQRRNKPYAIKFDRETTRMYLDKYKKTKNMTLKQFCKREGISQTSFWKACKKYFPDEYERANEDRLSKNRLYKRGRDFEYRVKALLENLGYLVWRSPASKSLVDLVAIKKGIILFVQCKRTGYIPFEERKKLKELADSVGAVPIYATSERYRGIKMYVVLEPNRSRKHEDNYAPFDPQNPPKEVDKDGC